MTIGDYTTLRSHCLSIDLEVNPKTEHIIKIAALRGDTDEAITANIHDHKHLHQTLEAIQEFGQGMKFLLGHNLIAFDVPRLQALCPGNEFFSKPAIDTLRLSPLAYPSNPYHNLVKHYKTGELVRSRSNDPELDARQALSLCGDHYKKLSECQQQRPELLTAWHWLTSMERSGSGSDDFWASVRHAPRPSAAEAQHAITRFLQPSAAGALACVKQTKAVQQKLSENGWQLSYALAWLSVAGGNSVMPPWVRHQFPGAAVLVKKLRDTPCGDSQCVWCRERHDAKKELQRWFGFDDFRSKPADKNQQPLQRKIAEAAMRGEHLLGVLPTGTGKSICYQLPALSRYDKTGDLTVVISPLVALMADQVAGLEAHDVTCSAMINGNLTLPERADVLNRIRLGDVGIVIISPEQLRNRSVRQALQQRQIGSWVLDEAHCISQWGHDFRPDYRYLYRVIQAHAESQAPSPVLCLTATAKREVIEEIKDYFHTKLGIDIRLIDGGCNRSDIAYQVVETELNSKMNDVFGLLQHHLPNGERGGAIVYRTTRRQAEETAEFIREQGMAAEYFHAGLSPEKKKDIQQRFIKGHYPVIAATNAFGMGIDKPDIRLVIHADIPSSVENYLQESGRAGRDRQGGHCVLLFAHGDVERQFSLLSRGRLSVWQINAVLRSLKRLHRRNNQHQQQKEIIATSGEILYEDESDDFKSDSLTDDTRVRTALLWLEERKFLQRDENRAFLFPSSLRVSSLDEAHKKLQGIENEHYRRRLLTMVAMLMNAPKDEGMSTDEFVGLGMEPKQVQKALRDLEKLGITIDDTALTAFLHVGVQHSSPHRYQETVALEKALLDCMREQHSEMGENESSILHLRGLNQRLKDQGQQTSLPQKLFQLLRSIAKDKHEHSGRRSISVRSLDMENVRITLHCSWSELEQRMHQRHVLAGKLLNHLLERVSGRGVDRLVETTYGQLNRAIRDELVSRGDVENQDQLRDHALLWLHEQDIIRLHRGLAVFRPAMTIRLFADSKRFLKDDFTQLKAYYTNQIIHVHIITEYARRGLQSMRDAMHLVKDYFVLEQSRFLGRWLPDKQEKELQRQTSIQSYKKIVSELNSRPQENIVCDDRERTNMLVLAGPGSGKTRVLVHRIAYLVRVRRENPGSILALAYNRHTMLEIRKRLKELIGDDARRLTILTCHALAMRLVGVSFDNLERPKKHNGKDPFADILVQAAALLNDETDDSQRERTLKSFRWILVDEYQDINEEQYELISAIAGRKLKEEDARLNLFAVGDDDQNIYEFAGASVKFIKRFTEEYKAQPQYLTENYRSTAHIIEAANHVIAPLQQRMKTEHPITVDRQRKMYAAGGDWDEHDPIAGGRVQIIPITAGHNRARDMANQAVLIMEELQRLAALDAPWDWQRVAVIARQWKYLSPIRSYCDKNHIPAQMANNESLPFLQLRETQLLIAKLRQHPSDKINEQLLRQYLGGRQDNTDNIWQQLLQQGIEEYVQESGRSSLTKEGFIMWLCDWGRKIQPRQKALLLTTAHRAKGLEFDHVAVLDGGWFGQSEEADVVRRLYYVAMTRARQTLTLAKLEPGNNLILQDLDGSSSAALLRRQLRQPIATIHPSLYYRYEQLSMKDVDIGFAGRYRPSHKIHATIAGLQVGDAIKMERQQSVWVLKDMQGRLIGRTARSFTISPAAIKSVRIHAIIRRRKQQGDTQYQDHIRCDEWELVLPEIRYMPIL